jgi:dienelactone hydrolase
MKKLTVFILFIMSTQLSNAQLKLTFPSKDGLTVTADWYPVSSDLPVILLCHQNRYSRGEYLETALRLNKFGFNCMALDQRVGEEVKGVKNETAEAAKKKNLTPGFADAEQDIVAALDFLFEKYNRPVMLLGSSYSASLVLKIAAENPKVSSVLVFSPGEYFDDKTYISKSIQTLSKPVFATSSRDEADAVTDLLKDVNSRIKIQYIPSTKGDHGSKVLWPESAYNQEYWIALMSFLNKIKPAK